MSARDIFHDVVKEALQREQWIIMIRCDLSLAM
jgi:hypothetical protein